jgi:5-methylcytosine-specific restriction endonuclease McrA
MRYAGENGMPSVFWILFNHPPGGVSMSESSASDCSVLVLNRFYMAVRVVDVRRAMTLLYRGCAEVIVIEEDQYANYDFENWCELSELHAMEKQNDEDYLRTPTRELQVPRIVRLVLYDRIPKSTVRFNRKTLFARDGYRCQYCGQTRPMSQLSLDHVVPRSQRQERRTDSGSGFHEVIDNPRSASCKSRYRGHVARPKVSFLENVSDERCKLTALQAN